MKSAAPFVSLLFALAFAGAVAVAVYAVVDFTLRRPSATSRCGTPVRSYPPAFGSR